MLRTGDHDGALAVSDRLLSDFNLTPRSLLFAGEVHFARANFARSAKIARNCANEFPDDPSGPILGCRALLALGKLGEARDLALKTAKKDIAGEHHLDILVTVLAGCMEPDAAYPLCKKAIEKDPYNVAAHRRLALICRLTGRLAEAAQAADVALRFNAHDYEMIGLRSAVQTATPDNNHIAALETLLAAGCANALGGARVAYALAKEHEELGNNRRAFGFLQAGARFKRQTIKYDIAEDLRAMQIVGELFTADKVAHSNAGFESGEAIFILGLPRTGSTLIERILSSHSEVYAAGELQHFSAAMMQEIRKLGQISDRLELVQKSIEIDHIEVGQAYIERGRPFTGHTPRFTDKQPMNFHSIGAIHLSLPNAKIIHVRRTPLDACYAIYKFLFNEAYAWSYDLDEIAQYYVGYRRLMDHWRAILPGRIIDVDYEDIVGDLENESKKLLAALGLEWEPACLDFHENRAAAMTGSAAQVRQKIYSSSVGRWRDYEEQLKPLAGKLEDAGIDPYSP